MYFLLMYIDVCKCYVFFVWFKILVCSLDIDCKG